MNAATTRYCLPFSVSLALMLTWGCTPPLTGGGEDTDPPGASSETDVPQGAAASADRPEDGSEQDSQISTDDCGTGHIPFSPLGDDELWFVATSLFAPPEDIFLMAMGADDSIFALTLASGAFLGDFMGGGCTGFPDDIELSIEDRVIHLKATLDDYESDQPCTIELTGTIDSCGHDTLGIIVFDLAGQATGTMGGEPFTLDGLQLVRVPLPEPLPCDDPPMTLDDREWSLGNANPDSLLGLGFPGGLMIDLSGYGNEVEYGGFFETQFEPEGEESGCFGSYPEGSFDFDGKILTVDVQLSNWESDEPCLIQFTGSVVECTLPGGLAFGIYGEDSAQVLRIEGEGVYAGGGLEGSIDTWYLTVHEPFDPFAWATPCEEPPLTLDGAEWSVARENPFSYRPVGDGVFIDFSGSGDAVEYGSLLGVVDFDDDFSECFGTSPDASITLDGQQFTLVAELEGWPDQGGPGSAAQTCTVSFTGSVQGCYLFEDYYDDYGFGSEASSVLLLEGSGGYSSAKAEGDFSTMYLTVRERLEPSVDLCEDPIEGPNDGDHWILASNDPFDLSQAPLLVPPLLTVFGSGGGVDEYVIVGDQEYFEEGGFCFAFAPDGSFSSDGQTITLDLSYEDRWSGCSVSFSGVLASCETLIDDVMFYTFDEVALLRYDGEGEVLVDGVSTPLPTLYFAVSSVDDYGPEGAFLPFPPLFP